MATIRVVELTGGAPGNRYSGAQARAAIEGALARNDSCAVDFAGIDSVTQSFADEAVGVLVRGRGPDVLDSLTFLHCVPAVRDVLEFVVDYSGQFWSTGTFPTPTPA